MAEIHARAILSKLGTNSVRDIFHETGSPLTSVAKQLQLAGIGSLYLKTGGAAGPLGLPLGNTRFGDGGGASRAFSGGVIKFLNVTPQGTQTTFVRVRFVGFHVNATAFGPGSDEPYFIVGVASTNGSRTVKFGPYEDIEAGQNRSEATLICDMDDGLVPPIVLGVVGMEHDEGSPEEAEEKVRQIFVSVERKIEEAGRSIGAFSGENHVVPEWLREILIGWVPEGVAAIFGLGDDHINTVNRVLFDFDPALEKWAPPPKIGIHEGNPYNLSLRVNQEGGDEGDYTLFFNIDIGVTDTTLFW